MAPIDGGIPPIVSKNVKMGDSASIIGKPPLIYPEVTSILNLTEEVQLIFSLTFNPCRIQQGFFPVQQILSDFDQKLELT